MLLIEAMKLKMTLVIYVIRIQDIHIHIYIYIEQLSLVSSLLLGWMVSFHILSDLIPLGCSPSGADPNI